MKSFDYFTACNSENWISDINLICCISYISNFNFYVNRKQQNGV